MYRLNLNDVYSYMKCSLRNSEISFINKTNKSNNSYTDSKVTKRDNSSSSSCSCTFFLQYSMLCSCVHDWMCVRVQACISSLSQNIDIELCVAVFFLRLLTFSLRSWRNFSPSGECLCLCLSFSSKNPYNRVIIFL